MKRIEAHRKCINILNKIEKFKIKINVIHRWVRLDLHTPNDIHHLKRLDMFIDYLELKYQKLKHQL